MSATVNARDGESTNRARCSGESNAATSGDVDKTPETGEGVKDKLAEMAAVPGIKSEEPAAK